MSNKNTLYISLGIMGTFAILVGIFMLSTFRFFSEKRILRDGGQIELFGRNIDTLEQLTDIEVKEHSRIASYLYTGKSYESFNDYDITVMVASSLLMNGDVATESEIQTFVTKNFEIDNFMLKEGTFDPIFKGENEEKLTIVKDNNVYTSNCKGKGLTSLQNVYEGFIASSRGLVVEYTYGIINSQTQKIEKELGKTFITYSYNDVLKSLVLENVVYEEN